MLAARGREHVAIAGRVDHDRCAHGEPAGLPLERDPFQALVLDDRIAGPGVKQQPRTGFLDHLVERELHFLGFVSHGVPHAMGPVAPEQTPALIAPHLRFVGTSPLFAGREIGGAPALQPIRHFLAQTRHHLTAAPVIEGQQQDDEAGRGETTQVAVALDQQNVGAVSGGSHRRGDTGGSASHHEHLGLVANRRPARRLLEKRK